MSQYRTPHVYVTRNTEYHVLDDTCVAVRDRSSRRWIERHAALRRRVQGGVRIHPNGAAVPSLEPPAVGDAIYFVIDEREGRSDLVTSKLEAITRADERDVARYRVA